MEIQKTLFHCSRDGLTIRGREYRPEGDCLPPIIVSHGFMANQSSVQHYAKRLAQWGFAPASISAAAACRAKAMDAPRI